MSRSLMFLAVATVAVACSLQPGSSTAFAKSNAAEVAAGRKLYQQLKCSSCHMIDEVGGCIAPPLANVTVRRSDAYLKLRLSADKEDEFIDLIKHPELFPHPRFQSRQVNSLLAYLKTLERKQPTTKIAVRHQVPPAIAQEKPSAKPFEPASPTASSREGRRLFLETGCMACHSVGNTGGDIGPALDGIGARHTRQYIEAHITDPQAHAKSTSRATRKSRMVQPGLFRDQVKALTNYLLTLPPIKP